MICIAGVKVGEGQAMVWFARVRVVVTRDQGGERGEAKVVIRDMGRWRTFSPGASAPRRIQAAGAVRVCEKSLLFSFITPSCLPQGISGQAVMRRERAVGGRGSRGGVRWRRIRRGDWCVQINAPYVLPLRIRGHRRKTEAMTNRLHNSNTYDRGRELSIGTLGVPGNCLHYPKRWVSGR